MVAQFIVGIGMHEDVERSVIEGEPTYDIGKLHRLKPDLVAPSWMRSDLSLVKATHLNPIAKLRGHDTIPSFIAVMGAGAAGTSPSAGPRECVRFIRGSEGKKTPLCSL